MSNLSLSGVQLPVKKPGSSKVIKPRALANCTPFTVDVTLRCPLPPGEGHEDATESKDCGSARIGGLLRRPGALSRAGRRERLAVESGAEKAVQSCRRVPRQRTGSPGCFLQFSCGPVQLSSSECRPGRGEAGKAILLGRWGTSVSRWGSGSPAHPGAWDKSGISTSIS